MCARSWPPLPSPMCSPVRRGRSWWTWDAAASATTSWSAAATIGRASVTSSSNPNALRVPGCATPARGVGDGWSAPFSDGVGLLAGAGIEFDIAGPLQLAFDYSRVQATIAQTVASTDARGLDFEKLSNELEVGRERLGAWRTACTASSTCIRSGAVPSGPTAAPVSDVRRCVRTSAGTGAGAPTRPPSRRAGISATSTRSVGTSPARPAAARPLPEERARVRACRRRRLRRRRTLQRGRPRQASPVLVGRGRAVRRRDAAGSRPQLAAGRQRARVDVVDAAGHRRDPLSPRPPGGEYRATPRRFGSAVDSTGARWSAMVV